MGISETDNSCTVGRGFAETTDTAFNNVACRLLMANAKFFPAIDSDGNPVASFYTSSIKYIIPSPAAIFLRRR